MTPVLVRPARAVDADDLRRLAALDSARPLTGDVLIAVSGGDVAAAISLEPAPSIADPFQSDRPPGRPAAHRRPPRARPPLARAPLRPPRRPRLSADPHGPRALGAGAEDRPVAAVRLAA